MDFDQFHQYCTAKAGVEESFPFDEHTLVFKVMGKIFAITRLGTETFTVNLKCNPERAIQLREEHGEIVSGYHMNKQHWNTVTFDGDLEGDLLVELINHSYELIVKSLPKKLKLELEELKNS